MIVPRWEWRTFGEEFGEADSRLEALVPEREEESDELYLLSLGSDASVKVRDGLMDVKELQAVDENGLEQWKPVLKAAFPLPAADVTRVTEALAAADPVLTRAEYGLEELVEEVVEPSAGLVAVDVHKRRRHYTFEGCMAELSELRAEQGTSRTIVLESEDPSRLIAAVRELGLDSRPNVCVARGLKELVGFGV